jgi:DNA-binding response OmpR family regulator
MTTYLQAGAERILVVDDTPANVQLLMRMLADRGYVPQAVGSGIEALAAVRSHPPDLILLDINMPGMNGFEVCQHLKADAALCEIPVLFISVLDGSDDKVKAFALGGVDYLTKPFQLDEVLSRVETHLKLRRLQRQLAAHNLHLERVVAERTRELEAAYLRVQDLSRIQGDFLLMISHEMRTPTHGLLGLGELLMRLCPPSDLLSRYEKLFAHSQDRLMGLFNDVTLIAEADEFACEQAQACACAEVLDQVRAALPRVQITLCGMDASQLGDIAGTTELCGRALITTLQLAQAFSRDKRALLLSARVDGQHLCLRLALDDLVLSDRQAQGFFALASSARAASAAEALGLAPAVAHRILRALGGDLQLVHGAEANGYLDITLRRVADPMANAGTAL